MSDSRACYRKLRRYKYQLMQDYTISIEVETQEDIEMSFLALTSEGELTIKNRYAWDGPSGPTIDTKSFMRGRAGRWFREQLNITCFKMQDT